MLRRTAIGFIVFFVSFSVYAFCRPPLQAMMLPGQTGCFNVGDVYLTSSSLLWVIESLRLRIPIIPHSLSLLSSLIGALTSGFFALFIDDVFPAKRFMEKAFVWMPISRLPLRLNHFLGLVVMGMAMPWVIFVSLNPYAISLGLLLAFSFSFWRASVVADAAPIMDAWFFVTLLWLLWRLKNRIFEVRTVPGDERWRTGPAKQISLIALFLGLALANNPGVFLLPLIVLGLLWQIERRIFKNLRSIFIILLFFCLGFSLFPLAKLGKSISVPTPAFYWKTFNSQILHSNIFPGEFLQQFTPYLLWLVPFGFWIMLKQSKFWAWASLFIFFLGGLGILPFTGHRLFCYIIAGWWMSYVLYTAEKWRLGLVIVSFLLFLAPILLFFVNG